MSLCPKCQTFWYNLEICPECEIPTYVENDSQGDFMYHGTDFNNLYSIARQGLLASLHGRNFGMSKDCIYLAGTLEGAEWWAKTNPGTPVILAIDASAIDWSRVCDDENAGPGPDREYWVNCIPPDAIKVLDNFDPAKLIPITEYVARAGLDKCQSIIGQEGI